MRQEVFAVPRVPQSAFLADNSRVLSQIGNCTENVGFLSDLLP